MRIYIWSHAKESLVVLFDCIYYGVQVDGFIVDKHSEYSETLGYKEILIDDIAFGDDVKVIGFQSDTYNDIEILDFRMQVPEMATRNSDKPIVRSATMYKTFFVLQILEQADNYPGYLVLGNEDEEDTFVIITMLNSFGIKNTVMSVDEYEASADIRNQYDGYRIILTALEKDLQHQYDRLIRLGLEEYDDFIGTRPFNYLGLNHDKLYRIVPHLGFGYSTEPGNETGYSILGKADENNCKIMVLGSSSMDEQYCFSPSLINRMFIELSKTNNVTVYNGSVRSYSMQQQLIKLTMDIATIRPTIVITEIGPINVTYKFVEGHSFVCETEDSICRERMDLRKQIYGNDDKIMYGLEDDFTQAEVVDNCLKSMQAICDAWGAVFVPIMWPNVTVKKSLTKYEKLCCYDVYCQKDPENRREQFLEYFPKWSQMYKYALDISHIFENDSEWRYVDRNHLSEKGNMILGNALYDHISKLI